MAYIFSLAFQQALFDTETIRDDNTAVKRLAVTVPAVVVLDLNLPHLSAKDLVAQIRTDERLAETRIMIVTAGTLLVEEIEQQADLVLYKPISFQQVYYFAKRLRPLDTVRLE